MVLYLYIKNQNKINYEKAYFINRSMYLWFV